MPATLFATHAPNTAATQSGPDSSRIPSAASQPPATLTAWENYQAAAGSMVRSASLADSGRGAEMHVALRSDTLGPLEVHATLRDGSVGAEIRVEDRQAHSILAAGLPSLERAMSERSLHVGSLAVLEGHPENATGGQQNRDAHSGSAPSSRPQTNPGEAPTRPLATAQESSETEDLEERTPRLSVRA